MTEPSASRPFVPEYGISESAEGMLPWSWAAERLERSHNYYLATTRGDGRPHVAPVWGLWLAGQFLFSTGATSRKAKNLRANSNCVVTTEDLAEAVILEGVASVVIDSGLLKDFVDAYKQKYDWEMEGHPGGIWAVTPRKAFGFQESEFEGASTRWEWVADRG